MEMRQEDRMDSQEDQVEERQIITQVEEDQVDLETLEGLHHQKVIQVQELHPDQTAEKHQEPVEDQLQQEQ
jgi:DNA-binding protein H-NS